MKLVRLKTRSLLSTQSVCDSIQRPRLKQLASAECAVLLMTFCIFPEAVIRSLAELKLLDAVMQVMDEAGTILDKSGHRCPAIAAGDRGHRLVATNQAPESERRRRWRQ